MKDKLKEETGNKYGGREKRKETLTTTHVYFFLPI